MWEVNNNSPIYLQLADHIKMDIVSGVYQPGDKLPTVRDLALLAAVNPNTMQKALQTLESTGLIFTNRTTGRFVTDDPSIVEEIRMSLANDYCHDFVTNVKKIGFANESIIELVNDNLN